MKNGARFSIAALALSWLAGCTVGPNYHRPAVQTPPAYRGLAPDAQAQAASYADLPWWEVFHDPQLATLLKDALANNGQIDEIWLRSPGGVARAGNEAGKLIRASGIPTRIPDGWACFSACNFMFMGGAVRFVDPGGLFIVHMFTHVGDKEAVKSELSKGTDKAIGLIGDVEQDSALLASEDNDFLIRMGVSRKLLTEVMYQQKAVASGSDDKSTRRCLTSAEAIKYNVANAQ